MTDVKGQEHVKRGLEVACAGKHSVLLVGSNGSGKSMIANRINTITNLPMLIVENMPDERRDVLDKRADFKGIIVATMLPCPCGNFTSPKRECQCTPYQIQRYLSKVSGRLSNRLDIHLNVPELDYKGISKSRKGEASSIIKARVDKATAIQLKRFSTNADMTVQDIEKFCQVDKEGDELFKMAILELGISARAYDKILKVARTIADLENKKEIEASHISEAISYRSLDRDFWVM